MNSTRIIERAIFQCPEIACGDCEKYPLASDEAFDKMFRTFCIYEGDPFIQLLLGMSSENVPFLDVYVWDDRFAPYQYKRFLFCDGMRLSEEDEDMLWEYIDENNDIEIMYDEKTIDYLEKHNCAEFDEYDDGSYLSIPPMELFDRLYFIGHRSGCREILYKAGLSNIAFNLEKIPDYNILGTSPESIIGHELPLRLINLLNKPVLLNHLFDENLIEKSKKVYRKYSDYWEKNVITASQWKYLEELYDNDGFFCQRKFSRALFRRLNSDWTGCLDEYKHYYFLKDQIEEVPELKKYFNRLPKDYEMFTILSKMEGYLRYNQPGNMDNKRVSQRKSDIMYEYCGKKYSVVLPKDAKEMCIEALEQRNCLMCYIDKHASGATTIVFLRENTEPDKPYVTIEICNGSVKQAYTKNNAYPSADVFVFLEEYSSRRGIRYNPVEIIGPWYECHNEINDYLDDYQKRKENEKTILAKLA